MDTKTILLDVGGTFIKRPGLPAVPIPSSGSREQIAAALREAVQSPGPGARVGVAIPGPFDYSGGVFLMKHKFAAVYGDSFRTLAGLPEDADLKFLHDVAAILAGAVRMLGLEKSNVALVTLGTGLGFANAVQGKVQFGPAGSPSISLWDQPVGSGILEDRISSRGISAAYSALTGDVLTPLEIATMAYEGNQEAIAVYKETGALLGAALKEVLNGIDAKVLLVGGQISKSLSLMATPLQNALSGIQIHPAPEGAVFEGLTSLFANH